MSYLDHFEDEEPDEYEVEYDDLYSAIATGKASEPLQFVLSEEAKVKFLSLLLTGDEGAMQAVAEFLAERERPKVTEVHHTIWTGQETTDGFFVYHINHNLGTSEVLVSLDSTELFTYSCKDSNTVVVVCPESLFGVDVEVRVK